MNKQEILKSALAARLDEVAMYQINIDNYTLAIQHIEANPDPDMDDFKTKLTELLKSEIVEQKKAKVMLAVVKSQME